jgi:hypothetical protein
MVFSLARTFSNPAGQVNRQRGFPGVGAGAQTTGTPQPGRGGGGVWQAARPIKGFRTWGRPTKGANPARGFGSPLSEGQSRRGEVVGHLAGDPPPFGEYVTHEYPYFSRGTAAYAPQFGQVSYNPIGAGVAVNNRVQASYGPSAQYENGEIFWTSQAIPTSVNLQGLTDPDALAAVLGPIYVQAAVRVEGGSNG